MTTQTSVATDAPDRSPAAAAPSGPRATLQVLRVVAIMHTLAMLVQPVLAGRYLSGDVQAIDLHRINAGVVTAFDAVQLICAIVFTWAGRGRSWPIYASLATALAVEVQVGVGFERVLAVHIPLGVSIIVTQVLVTVWLFRSGAAVGRVRRPRKERGKGRGR
jgi:hypothetical protein